MFSSFISAGVEFHVLAAHLVCFLRMVSLFKLERRLAPSRSVYDCEDTGISLPVSLQDLALTKSRDKLRSFSSFSFGDV